MARDGENTMISKERLNLNRFIDDNGCWVWTGNKTKLGYGKITIQYRNQYVHRVSAHLYLGFDLNSDVQVQHKCNNPSCFNPEHFDFGDQSKNIRYAVEQGRHGRKNQFSSVGLCIHGHAFTPENTILSLRGRSCRICKNLNSIKYRAIKKGKLHETS